MPTETLKHLHLDVQSILTIDPNTTVDGNLMLYVSFEIVDGKIVSASLKQDDLHITEHRGYIRSYSRRVMERELYPNWPEVD